MSPVTGLAGRNLVKEFPGGVRALDGVSFDAPSGEILTLLGPSGCGKTTLLRSIAGLETPTSGSLELDGADLLSVPPGKRDVGFVFQNYALYPHLTVAGNMSLALEARGLERAERERRIRETAALLGIEGLLDRKPGQLSGGQQQRVALGRALARRPRLFLLDEPLSNLDALLRDAMRGELRSLLRRVGATAVYVTHDQAEAMGLSDRIAVMRGGRILQHGTPRDVYREPADLFTATFVGSPSMTLWRVRRAEGGCRAEDVRLDVSPPAGAPDEVWAGIRPEDVEIATEPGSGRFEATIESAELLGARSLLTLRSGGSTMRALATPDAWSGRVWVRFPAPSIHWFDPATERRIPSAGAKGAA
ncbi:MAG TPA: ABC transporter ATP-binding protein [Candidatus Eisenbacteria bacterium]|nr:ABC transporter ATP-binding protein [Candidatus Eisenbacteria bacterium]